MRAQAMPRMEVTDMVDGSSPRRLGELLVADGLITDALVREALEIQQCLQVHMRLGDILVYWKALSRHQVELRSPSSSTRRRNSPLFWRALAPPLGNATRSDRPARRRIAPVRGEPRRGPGGRGTLPYIERRTSDDRETGILREVRRHGHRLSNPQVGRPASQGRPRPWPFSLRAGGFPPLPGRWGAKAGVLIIPVAWHKLCVGAAALRSAPRQTRGSRMGPRPAAS